MPVYFLIRIVSIATVLLVAVQSPNDTTWVALVYGFGFAHYLMALIYSKRQLTALASQPLGLVTLLSLVVCGAGLYYVQFPLLVFFALHHAFNEAYILKHTIQSDNHAVRALRVSAVLLHLCLYFFLLRHTPTIGFVDLSVVYASISRGADGAGMVKTKLLLAGLMCSYGLFFYYLYRIRSCLNLRTFIENSALELLALVAIAASFYVNVNPHQIILYHCVFWSLFPVPKIWAAASRELTVYLGLTTLCTTFFLFLSPLSVAKHGLSAFVFQEQFKLWSYIHLTASFALSNAHPDWITGLFRSGMQARDAV